MSDSTLQLNWNVGEKCNYCLVKCTAAVLNSAFKGPVAILNAYNAFVQIKEKMFKVKKKKKNLSRVIPHWKLRSLQTIIIIDKTIQWILLPCLLSD